VGAFLFKIVFYGRVNSEQNKHRGAIFFVEERHRDRGVTKTSLAGRTNNDYAGAVIKAMRRFGWPGKRSEENESRGPKGR
jgi:hypothetical protein